MIKKPAQRIRYLGTPDGVQLAWAEAGAGPTLIKAANWMTHLEYEWESPVWRHWIRFFSEHFRFVRHDERGCGMTDWNVGDLSFARWIEDLEAVVATVNPQEPFALLGISQGAATCIAYAVKHPERVSRLVLYGGYARGTYRRGDPDKERLYRALIDMTRLGWGKDNPAFRQVFTSRFIPGATDEQVGWFNELCRKTTSPEIAARLLETRATIDVMDLLDRVQAPTLILHSRDDDVYRSQKDTFSPQEFRARSLLSLIRRTTSSSTASRRGNASAPRSSISRTLKSLPARILHLSHSRRVSVKCWR
jgi:pimeloyl-ACP methyl ester carboxylesterase